MIERFTAHQFSSCKYVANDDLKKVNYFKIYSIRFNNINENLGLLSELE